MLPTRFTAAAAAVLCAVGGAAAVSTATATASAPAKIARPAQENHNVKLTAKKTKIGTILVQNGGLIVYVFTHDKKNKNTCPASSGCAAVWPPIVGTPTLGPGVKRSLIGSIKDGSQKQVTYDGHPLYGYEYNSSSVSYVGYANFGGSWDAVSPGGSIVHNKPV